VYAHSGALGAVPPDDPRWQTLLANYEWVNAHPLIESDLVRADPYEDPGGYAAQEAAYQDAVQTRTLVLAALTHAQNVLQGTDNAAADQAFQDAQATYGAYVQQVKAKEMPSGFLLWLSNLDVPGRLLKVGGLVAAGAALYFLAPVAVAAIGRAGGSKSA
jgi:hypothetical protein